jgi:hypothetical protein
MPKMHFLVLVVSKLISDCEVVPDANKLPFPPLTIGLYSKLSRTSFVKIFAVFLTQAAYQLVMTPFVYNVQFQL